MSTSTPLWELPTDLTDGQTAYTGAQIERFNRIAETQVTGILLALLGARTSAVVERSDSDSFVVAAGLGLSVTIAAGSAITTHPTYGPCWLRTPALIVRGAIPASSVRYLFAAFERTGGVDSRVSGLPIFPLAETQTITGGVLLAKLTSDASSVVVEDLRGELLGSGVVAPTGGTGSGAATRIVKVTSSSLASGAKDATKIAMLGARALIGRVATSVAAWVRIYPTASDRDADALRGINDDPSEGVSVAFECVTLGAAPLNAANASLFDPENDGWPCTIVNLSGATASVEVTFTVG